MSYSERLPSYQRWIGIVHWSILRDQRYEENSPVNATCASYSQAGQTVVRGIARLGRQQRRTVILWNHASPVTSADSRILPPDKALTVNVSSPGFQVVGAERDWL